jgi:hypothetical protein
VAKIVQYFVKRRNQGSERTLCERYNVVAEGTCQALQAHTAQVQAVLCSRNGTFVLHCKKILAIFPSPAEISLTKQLSLAMEEFV